MTFLPASQYELVTVENLLAVLSSPLFLWERWMTANETKQYPGAKERSALVLNREAFKTGGRWYEWDDTAKFPFQSRSSIPTWEVTGGYRRRPLSAEQLKRMEKGRTNFRSEQEALAEFFQTPAGKWRGYITEQEK